MKATIKSLELARDVNWGSTKTLHVVTIDGIQNYADLRKGVGLLNEIQSELYTPRIESNLDCTGTYYTKSITIEMKSYDYQTLNAILIEHGGFDI